MDRLTDSTRDEAPSPDDRAATTRAVREAVAQLWREAPKPQPRTTEGGAPPATLDNTREAATARGIHGGVDLYLTEKSGVTRRRGPRRSRSGPQPRVG